MPAKRQTSGAVSAAEIEAKLPKSFFVRRGHVREAFGLSEEDMTALVGNKTFAAEYPVKGGRACFVRTKILAVARRWEGAA